MNLREESDWDDAVINLTPLIDVVFLLLIFFMVTTTFLDPEREIEVELPTAQSGGEPQRAPEELILNVMQDGRVFMEQRELARAELDTVLKSAAQRDATTPVTIRGHRLAAHEKIVQVMDACGSAGLSNLAVGTSYEDEG